MKRGGTLDLVAEGRLFKDEDYCGNRFYAVEDLALFWPRKSRDKKDYLVKEELVADWDQVGGAFYEAIRNSR
jgi:hypothetical protein